jgi:pimeloyl-ACP methyl ester carboxylesterase
VADVVGLLDAAGLQQAHVVGHDWGGAVAWAVAGAVPERVSSLTVVSTPHPAALLRSMVTSRQALRSWYMAFFQLPVLPERYAARDLGGQLRRSGLPEAPAQRYAERMSEPGVLSAALNWYRGMPFSLRTPARVTRVPTTFVWGVRDFALGRTAAELTERFVRAPYEFVALEAGHWLPETRPQEVAEAVLGRCRSVMAG